MNDDELRTRIREEMSKVIPDSDSMPGLMNALVDIAVRYVREAQDRDGSFYTQSATETL